MSGPTVLQEAGGMRWLKKREEEEHKIGEGKETGGKEQRMLILPKFGEMYWTYNQRKNWAQC